MAKATYDFIKVPRKLLPNSDEVHFLGDDIWFLTDTIRDNPKKDFFHLEEDGTLSLYHQAFIPGSEKEILFDVEYFDKEDNGIGNWFPGRLMYRARMFAGGCLDNIELVWHDLPCKKEDEHEVSKENEMLTDLTVGALNTTLHYKIILDGIDDAIKNLPPIIDEDDMIKCINQIKDLLDTYDEYRRD